jgi:hypothetical protein
VAHAHLSFERVEQLLEGHVCASSAVMSTPADGMLPDLESGPLHSFADWRHREIPAVAASVYTVWDGEDLIYVGVAGRSLTAESILRRREDVTKVTGLPSRLNSHASGRRSGDQFCLYIFDLLVLPDLDRGMVARIAGREIKLDDLVRRSGATSASGSATATCRPRTASVHVSSRRMSDAGSWTPVAQC